ncbi:MAG: major capsid protein [Firmicutes bacterium]|nr:major capsid protein [Bacillota bacterium]
MATVNAYDVRTMLAALKVMLPAKTFLRDTFFSTPITPLTEHVDIDIVKGKRKLAPFVSPRIGSKTVETMGFKTNTYKPPQVGLDYPFTGEDLQTRMPGENIYSDVNPDERQAYLVGEKLREFDDYIAHREEWMCMKALYTGIVPVSGEGVSQTIDFGFTNKTTLYSSSDYGAKYTWDYTSSDYEGDPIRDLKMMRKAILKSSGINPTHVVMASDAAEAFMNHPTVKEKYNNFQANFGQFTPQALSPDGTTFIAHINEIGMDLYSYDEWYIDPDTDVETSLVPSGAVLMASKNAGFKMMYGAVIDPVRGTFAMSRVPNSWYEAKPAKRFIQVVSRPLPVPFLVDSYYVLNVLTPA